MKIRIKIKNTDEILDLKFQYIIMFIPMVNIIFILQSWISAQRETFSIFVKFVFMALCVVGLSELQNTLIENIPGEIIKETIYYLFIYLQTVLMSFLAILDQKRLIKKYKIKTRSAAQKIDNEHINQ